MGFFSPDGAFYKFISRFWDMVKINFLWVVCALPSLLAGYYLSNYVNVYLGYGALILLFFPVGPATVAGFAGTMRMVDDSEGYIGKQFISDFKKNIRNGIPLGYIMLIAILAVSLDFRLFNAAPGNPIIFLIMGIVLLFLILMYFVYAFPLSARYENTMINTLRNSAKIATRYFVRTLLLFIVLAVELFFGLFNLTTMIFLVLIGPACIFLTISGFAIPFFKEIEKEEGSVTGKE